MILYCMFLIKNSDSQEMGDSDSSGTHGVFSVSDCTSNLSHYFKSSALSNDQVASCIKDVLCAIGLVIVSLRVALVKFIIILFQMARLFQKQVLYDVGMHKLLVHFIVKCTQLQWKRFPGHSSRTMSFDDPSKDVITIQ